jgi:energy-converting hydrogenase Eha subunit C
MNDMNTSLSITDVVRGMAVLSVLGLFGVLLYYLPQPGYSQSRLFLFGLIAGAAVLGGAGVVLRRATLTAVGIFGLFLLGFWQAVLSVFVLPVAALLVVAALLDRPENTPTINTNQSS